MVYLLTPSFPYQLFFQYAKLPFHIAAESYGMHIYMPMLCVVYLSSSIKVVFMAPTSLLSFIRKTLTYYPRLSRMSSVLT